MPFVINGGGSIVASVTGTAAIRPEAAANARLMAAAPELLAALKTTLAICAHRWRALPSDAPEKVAIEAARAAIAKASP